MFELKESLNAWGATDFNDCFKAEVERLPHAALPLQQALAYTACVSREPFTVMVLNASDEGDGIRVKAGVFYTGNIGGCSCADDPTPNDTMREHCELQFDIDKVTAETIVTLL